MQTKIIVMCSFLAFLLVFYLGSIYVAYNKGYNKHVLEVGKQATEVVMGSHTDILVAAQEVKNNEKNIKTDDECSIIWDFDLHKCLLKN